MHANKGRYFGLSATMEGGPAGIYNIVDDELVEVSAWLPELTRTIGAKLPYQRLVKH
jgi:hypothetical protein